jgi:hypothetical protein
MAISALEERMALVWANFAGTGTRGWTPRTVAHWGMRPWNGMVSWNWAPSSPYIFFVHCFTAGSMPKYIRW